MPVNTLSSPAPRPENWYRIRDVVAIYAYPQDKHGRTIEGAAPVWTLLPRWARELFSELARMSRRRRPWVSYEFIAADITHVTPERARQQVRALCNWGFLVKHHRADEHGWFTANEYDLVDPFAPLGVLAVAVRTYDRREPIKTIRVSQQGDVPAYARPRRADRPRLVPAPPAPAPAVILRERYRNIAQAHGLIDPRLQHEAWRRFQAALERYKARGRKVNRPAGLWVTIVRAVLSEVQQGTEGIGEVAPDPSPAQVDKVVSLADRERMNRRSFIVTEAFKELMAGADPARVAAVIFTNPRLLAHCRLSECPLEEIENLVREAHSRLPAS